MAEQPQPLGDTRVHALLAEEVEKVRGPEDAEAVIQKIDALAAGKTEAQRGDEAMAKPPAADHLAQAAGAATGKNDEVAAVIDAAAAEAVAPTAAAPEVVAAAQQSLGPRPNGISPRARDGRRYLRDAVLRRMGPFQRADASVYLAINHLPHPVWLDHAAHLVTLIATGGWIWIAGTVAARELGVVRARRVVRIMAPSVILATWTVEYPLKAYFRRTRPFIDVVRALVIGKKPGSWSFPSGHTASSFASAFVLTLAWPRLGPLFFGLASTVGVSRVYVGAHYPGDVLSGAALGMGLAGLIRRGVLELLKER
ncbi:MAG: phosphatase PAP2 family protein [Chloroflexi bacterium]|nr:phosphatase PAP2 family protein [Chloroflexota bacterium]